MKKGIAKLFILALALCVFLCACGGVADSDEVFDSDFGGTDGTYNLDGYTIKYLCGYDEGTYLGYTEDTFLYDMALQRVADIEKEYNCVINASTYKDGDSSLMITATAGGSYFGDAFSWEGDMLEDAAAAGLLVGLSNVAEFLDITDTEKWGTKYQLESICYNDDVYGFIPYLWPERAYSEIGHFLSINEDVVAKLGATDPREYVEAKNWVWETFRKSIESLTMTEGSETTVYALSYPEGAFAHMYLSSNGSHLVAIDEGGNIYNGFTDARAMKAMQEAVEVKNAYEYAFIR